MKKTVSLILIVLIIILMGGTVNAALSCNVTMKVKSTEYSKGDEFTIEVNTSKLKSENGIVAFQGTLDYDKDSLTLKKCEGANGWSTPSYNESNGKLIADISNNNPSTSDETIMKLTFKVNKNSKSSLKIALKDIKIANGYDDVVEINSVSKTIKIKDGSNTSVTPTPSTKATPSSTSTSKTTPLPTGKLPQTGLGDMTTIMIVVGVFAVIAIIAAIMVKKIGKLK